MILPGEGSDMFQVHSCIVTGAYTCLRSRIPSDYCLMLYFINITVNLGVGVSSASRVQKSKDTAEIKVDLHFL